MMNKTTILNYTDKLILHFYQHHYLKHRIDYHPLPWLNIQKSFRGEGCYQRLQALSQFLKASKIKNGVVLDVGCHIGFFSLSLKEKGFCVYGVDQDAFSLRIAEIVGHAIKKGEFFPVHMSIDAKKAAHVPSTDICLCLSIWHNWIKNYGPKEATTILRSLYKKTKKVLFFETEAIKNFSIQKYLIKTLNPYKVLCLGSFLYPKTARCEMHKRELLAVIKEWS